MTRRVKDFIDIRDHLSLDELIDSLKALRESLPDDAEAELRLRGDDIFGRKLSISYFRDQTPEEAECELRYAEAYKEGRERELDRLQEELGVVCTAPDSSERLRAIA
jgi:hypothetical protein